LDTRPKRRGYWVVSQKYLLEVERERVWMKLSTMKNGNA
jgi:hypothetical protein